MKKVKQQKTERPQAPVRQLEARELLITKAGATRTLVACDCACAAEVACDC
jgi:hypothetical protein